MKRLLMVLLLAPTAAFAQASPDSPAAPTAHVAEPGEAGSAKIGGIVIENAWVRGTPPGAPVAGGYLTIRNTGSAPDRLIGGTATFAGAVEVHEMTMANGVMQMAPLPEGLPIAPGETVSLAPGGDHLMFMDLTAPAEPGTTVVVTLDFAEAGPVEMAMPVSPLGAQSFDGHSGDAGAGHGEGASH
ncbi:copper chaperone PCu(A)C [Acuticoccus sp. M5D2P5]|uniref:copper chaperone PCu(A)C n=1 Tax=Acuticoccus kalidii TaxID=2910977 RepID=UPI001F44E108|nr:copper chaperone PCu(A)C [Acuticoccus kalidii]MCF3936308.1 copper chaperone PCu(A)C [Acuticoccus kalidii]